MKRNQIITHRGLEPSQNNFYPESSLEAFRNHLGRGFGIEFDANFTKDGIIIAHDSNLGRITQGKDTRDFSDIRTSEVRSIKYGNSKKGRIPTLDEVLQLIANSKSQINALHLKGNFQTQKNTEQLLEIISKHPGIIEKVLIFDVKPEIAKYLKQKLPNLHLAPSVSHPYDIKRYNKAVNYTLITIDDAIKYKNESLYDWVWLDEWDRADKNGKEKILYSKSVFQILRKEKFKIALVTPELHGTSPGLLGGEAHPDAKDKKTLFNRIREIILLKPDAICTDYPEEILRI